MSSISDVIKKSIKMLFNFKIGKVMIGEILIWSGGISVGFFFVGFVIKSLDEEYLHNSLSRNFPDLGIIGFIYKTGYYIISFIFISFVIYLIYSFIKEKLMDK